MLLITFHNVTSRGIRSVVIIRPYSFYHIDLAVFNRRRQRSDTFAAIENNLMKCYNTDMNGHGPENIKEKSEWRIRRRNISAGYVIPALILRITEKNIRKLQPEKYADTISKVIQKGSTPAGMHLSICVKEILDFLKIQPGQTGWMQRLGMAAIRKDAGMPAVGGPSICAGRRSY